MDDWLCTLTVLLLIGERAVLSSKRILAIQLLMHWQDWLPDFKQTVVIIKDITRGTLQIKLGCGWLPGEAEQLGGRAPFPLPNELLCSSRW